jgi:hypothetical protein
MHVVCLVPLACRSSYDDDPFPGSTYAYTYTKILNVLGFAFWTKVTCRRFWFGLGFFFGSIEVLTQGFAYARQELYHLNHTSSPIFLKQIFFFF